MALPRKKTRIDFQQAHVRRSLPAKLEEYLEANGYVLRSMSAMAQWAVAAQAELIYPLTAADLKESCGAEADRLIRDCLDANFTLMEDGTFQRGDVRLYVQTVGARDAVREARLTERKERASEEHVYDKIDEMNQALQEEARGLARVEPGLHGGGSVPSLRDHASGGVAELNRTRNMASALAGQQEE
jgi:hypothetical protein